MAPAVPLAALAVLGAVLTSPSKCARVSVPPARGPPYGPPPGADRYDADRYDRDPRDRRIDPRAPPPRRGAYDDRNRPLPYGGGPPPPPPRRAAYGDAPRAPYGDGAGDLGGPASLELSRERAPVDAPYGSHDEASSTNAVVHNTRSYSGHDARELGGYERSYLTDPRDRGYSHERAYAERGAPLRRANSGYEGIDPRDRSLYVDDRAYSGSDPRDPGRYPSDIAARGRAAVDPQYLSRSYSSGGSGLLGEAPGDRAARGGGRGEGPRVDPRSLGSGPDEAALGGVSSRREVRSLEALAADLQRGGVAHGGPDAAATPPAERREIRSLETLAAETRPARSGQPTDKKEVRSLEAFAAEQAREPRKHRQVGAGGVALRDGVTRKGSKDGLDDAAEADSRDWRAEAAAFRAAGDQGQKGGDVMDEQSRDKAKNTGDSNDAKKSSGGGKNRGGAPIEAQKSADSSDGKKSGRKKGGSEGKKGGEKGVVKAKIEASQEGKGATNKGSKKAQKQQEPSPTTGDSKKAVAKGAANESGKKGSWRKKGADSEVGSKKKGGGGGKKVGDGSNDNDRNKSSEGRKSDGDGGGQTDKKKKYANSRKGFHANWRAEGKAWLANVGEQSSSSSSSQQVIRSTIEFFCESASIDSIACTLDQDCAARACVRESADGFEERSSPYYAAKFLDYAVSQWKTDSGLTCKVEETLGKGKSCLKELFPFKA